MSSSVAFHQKIRPSKGAVSLRLDELWACREVGWMLALRDVKLRYRQTALGIVWVGLQPLLAGLVFAVLFGHFARLPSGGQPYILFAFSGLLGWNLFAGILQRSGNSLVGEARLITKVYFPRLLVPLAAAISALVDFGVSLLVMAGFLAWFREWPGFALCLLPVVVVLIAGLSLGLGLWVAALNVRYRDFAYALPFFVQLWMYVSPVAYGIELVPEGLRPMYSLNPMTGLIGAMRAALLGVDVPWPALAVSAGWATVALVSGLWFFRRAERQFTDNL